MAITYCVVVPFGREEDGTLVPAQATLWPPRRRPATGRPQHQADNREAQGPDPGLGLFGSRPATEHRPGRGFAATVDNPGDQSQPNPRDTG